MLNRERSVPGHVSLARLGHFSPCVDDIAQARHYVALEDLAIQEFWESWSFDEYNNWAK